MTVQVPIENCFEPDPEWGARRRNEKFVQVKRFFFTLISFIYSLK